MNLFVTGDALLTAGLGSQEDLRAERDLKRLFPGREVRMLDMSEILNGGGGIRCLTQPVPI
jgi:agmatine deiminase